jgi:hypothetical protein
MRLAASLIATTLAACATPSDMRIDQSVSGADRSLAMRMSELTMERCVRQQYDSAVYKHPGGQSKFPDLPPVRRLFRSDKGWVRAEIATSGVWDNVYFLESRNSVICGEPNWQKLADSTLVRFYDVKADQPMPGTPATLPPPTSTSSVSERRAVAFAWEGQPNLLAGTVTLEQQGLKGKIQAKLPAGDGDCNGVYEASATGTGQWALSCSNGLTAVGSFRVLGAGKGSVGSGTDSKGKRVEFTVAGTQ